MHFHGFAFNSANAQRSRPVDRWSIYHAPLFLCVVISGLIAWTMPFTNEDLFLALCAGRDIFAGRLAAPDQWCFSASGIVWVDHSWLSHLIYYLSYRWLEDLGPVLLKAALLSASLGLLYFRCRALSVPPGISMIALTLGTLSLAPFLKIRAENFGMFYFVLLTTILTLPPSQGKWRYPASLLVLGVWSNGHGSFMLGFLLIGLRFLVTLLYRMEAKRGESAAAELLHEQSQDVSWWAVTLALSVPIMAFANPYGPENLSMLSPQYVAKPITDLWIDWHL